MHLPAAFVQQAGFRAAVARVAQDLEPLEQWGVLPYFYFRSHSEQGKLQQPVLA